MSAYFCDKVTIDRVIEAIRVVDLDPADVLANKTAIMTVRRLLGDPDRLGRELWRLNRDSMVARYPRLLRTEKDKRMRAEASGYTVGRRPQVDGLQMVKSIACWTYQTCESDKATRSALYRYVVAVQGRLSFQLVREELRYERAEWA